MSHLTPSLCDKCVETSKIILLLTGIVVGSVGLAGKIDTKLLAKIALTTNIALLALAIYDIRQFATMSMTEEQANSLIARIKPQLLGSLSISILAICILSGAKSTSIGLGIGLILTSLGTGIVHCCNQT